MQDGAAHDDVSEVVGERQTLAGERSVRRLARRLGVELTHWEEALRKPVAEIQMRANRLRAALDDLDRSLVALRFLFDAVEADLGTQIRPAPHTVLP